MWDNPRLLNQAAGFLTGVAAMLLLYGGLQLLLRSALFPVKDIVVKGDLESTSRGEIEGAVGHLQANFFAADLAALRGRLERLPWVRGVDVRRVWPDRLEIALEEHVALARWGEDALVNTFGERFAGRSDAALPVFAGPAGTEAEMARRYRRFSELVAPLGTAIERVVLSPRLAWQLRLENGLNVVLGREADAAEIRLGRLVGVYSITLKTIARRHEYVDLRYPNGFALRVSGL